MPKFRMDYHDQNGERQSITVEAENKYAAQKLCPNPPAMILRPADEEQSEDATSASEDPVGEDTGQPSAGEGGDVSTAESPADPADPATTEGTPPDAAA